MGLIGRLMWVNCYGKKKCRSVFWRIRAAIKRAALKNGLKRQQLNFQYDPSSYALNFDDGCCKLGDIDKAFLQEDKFVWVYAIWDIKS